jgi:hypothetical protein
MSGREAERIERGDGTRGTPSSRLGAEMLRTLALFAVVAAVVAVAADRFDSGTAQPDAALTVVRGPASVRGQVALLAGGRDELRVTVDVRTGGSATTGFVLLRGATFAVRGRPRCVRTDGDTAIVGLSWTARDVLWADRPTKGAAILTFLARGARLFGMYDVSLGLRPPACTRVRTAGASPATGRLLISRR